MIEIPLHVIKAAALAVAREEGRFSFQAIEVREFRESYLLTAMDGRMLLRVRGPLPVPQPESEGKDRYLLPAPALAPLIKTGAKGDTVRLLAQDGNIQITSGQLSYSVPEGEGRYPDVDALVRNNRGGLLGVMLGAAFLSRLAGVAGLLCAKSDANVRLIVPVNGAHDPTLYHIDDAEGGVRAEGLVMPLTDDRNGPATAAERAAALAEGEADAADVRIYVEDISPVS